jgi:hypothetical protein
MLVLVRSAVTEATPSSSFKTQAMQPPAEAAHTMSNEWYRAINNDGRYKYKPNQHISGVKICWENPNIPEYAAYLNPEMQAGNPILLGSMGPGQPIYGSNLQLQPYHTVELEHFPKVSFDCLTNPLNPHIDRAVTTLGDLGVMADVFCLRQLPLKYMDQAHQMAYLGHGWDQGLLHWQSETWSWRRLQSKRTLEQLRYSYALPLISTAIESLEKYQHGSITLALLTEGHGMNTTCGLWLG